MPRYTFRTSVGSAAPRDDGSFELDDVEAAKRRADEIRAVEAKASPESGVSVEVWDGDGQHLHTVMSV